MLSASTSMGERRALTAAANKLSPFLSVSMANWKGGRWVAETLRLYSSAHENAPPALFGRAVHAKEPQVSACGREDHGDVRRLWSGARVSRKVDDDADEWDPRWQ